MSLPVRARGLKRRKGYVSLPPWYVAPRAGAWIETDTANANLMALEVAPRAGAWIETAIALLWCSMEGMSLPVRERGLKLLNGYQVGQLLWSLPVRERGLKPCS